MIIWTTNKLMTTEEKVEALTIIVSFLLRKHRGVSPAETLLVELAMRNLNIKP